MRKKVDSRIQTLIENIIALHQRGFFVIVGDRGRDQVVNLHYLLSKHITKSKPKVLWCYKKELGFSSHYNKRMKEIKRQQQKGQYDQDMENPFELFVSSNEIRYCYYKDSQKVLGQTFQMLILQDFESITPNILCRTIETVSGGGLCILLIKTMKSLRQLYSLVMDAHNKFRTEAFQDVVPRFNERFLLSLTNCHNFIAMDDELNILPISTLINDIEPAKAENSIDYKSKQQLKELQQSMKDNNLVGPLISIAKTLDQAKAVMMFIEAITEKNFRSTISLTAGRGRGKSAAIGLSVAAAIQCGFSNIFVSAPTPENLQTFFEFVIQGLESLGFKENMHYDILQSTNQEFNNCIIRINIFKSHRQFVQFVFPHDSAKLGQADLVIIDEAASIPLNYVKQMIGPYVLFLSSTVNGYEGTGRSLSLKLISQLREQNRSMNQENQNRSGARVLKEITLEDPIRYSPGDPIEKWLNNLLLLDATQAIPIRSGLPHPDQCELFLVNRDTLFSYHKASEQFLFNMMSLFISSHYKNSPNDLQLLSDAPGHAVFVLLENQDKEGQKNKIPDILCIVQLAFEGQIQQSDHQRGSKPAGDLIPWVMREQYQDDNFPKLCGARVVRIATHPQAQKMGYGKKTLDILGQYFLGNIVNLDDKAQEDFFQGPIKNETQDNELQTEVLKPKKKLKPLLKKLQDVKPPKVDYLGVSYGLTPELFKFWRKSDFHPTYLRQTKNDITAEHSCIMLKMLQHDSAEENNWVQNFFDDFQRRYISLLSFDFRALSTSLCLGILNPRLSGSEDTNLNEIKKDELSNQITLYDLKRLDSYKKNQVDYHLILDLLPTLARLFFLRRFKSTLSYAQAAILLGMGLQHKNIEHVCEELNLPVSQSLALFVKAIAKLTNEITSIYTEEIEKNMQVKEHELNPNKGNQAKELAQEGKQFIKQLEDKQKQQNGKKNRFDLTDLDEKQLLSQKNQSSLLAKRQQAKNDDSYQQGQKKNKKK